MAKGKADPSPEAVAARETNAALLDRPLPSLRDLGEAQAILDTFLEETEGEETPEIRDLWNELRGDTETKVQRYGMYLLNRESQAALMKAEADFFAAEAKRMSHRLQSFEAATERKRAYLLVQLQEQQIPDVKGPLCSVARQKTPPTVIGELDRETLETLFLDERMQRFVRHIPENFEVDKVAVKAAFAAQQPIPAGLGVVQRERVVVK